MVKYTRKKSKDQLKSKKKTIREIRSFYEKKLNTKLGKPKKEGRVQTLCPFHNDTEPSLSINLKTGFWKCFGECDETGDMQAFEKKLRKVNRKKAKNVLKEKSDVKPKKGTKGKVIARFNYKNEKGKTKYQVRKYEPKNFCVFTKEEKGGWKAGLKKKARIPYNLPAIIKKDKIYICEGEKDADNLAKLDFTTSTAFGSHWLDQYNKYFEGKYVRILPDNDEAGRKFAFKVAVSLYGTAKSIKIIRLPGLGEKETLVTGSVVVGQGKS